MVHAGLRRLRAIAEELRAAEDSDDEEEEEEEKSGRCRRECQQPPGDTAMETDSLEIEVYISYPLCSLTNGEYTGGGEFIIRRVALTPLLPRVLFIYLERYCTASCFSTAQSAGGARARRSVCLCFCAIFQLTYFRARAET